MVAPSKLNMHQTAVSPSQYEFLFPLICSQTKALNRPQPRPLHPTSLEVNRSPSQDNDPTDGVQNASCSHSPCNYPSEAQPFEASYET